MTVDNGESGRVNSTINVTPMIDVLLVLLIIFMVIVPAVPKGESAQLPKASLKGDRPNDVVVLELLRSAAGDVNFRINQRDIAQRDLPSRLAAIYANRAERVLFVKGDDGLSFTQVAQAIDVGHAAGADRIGLITPKANVSQ
jgi:biopolymer transport protein TolR